MKRLLIIAVLAVGIFSIAEAKPNKHRIAYGIFYTHLAPHGVWMEFNDGIIVWRPTIIRKTWAPYSLGRWIWTEYGWYWDSYEPFGYITYHYGRWFYDDYYGWIWIPDFDWAPAWVEWRYDDSYVGWAPLPPYAVFSANIGIHFTFNYVTPYHHWHFVQYNYMCDPYVYNHYVSPKYKYRIYSNTQYRNDYSYVNGRVINRGIDVEQVRVKSGQEIRQRNIQQVSDLRQLRNNSMEKDDNSTIKTFIASRDELKKYSSGDDFDIRKIERGSSLETSRLMIGEKRQEKENSKLKSRSDEQRIFYKDHEFKDYHIRRNNNDLNDRLDEFRENEIRKNRDRTQSNLNYDIISKSYERQNKEELNFNSEIIRNEKVRREKVNADYKGTHSYENEQSRKEIIREKRTDTRIELNKRNSDDVPNRFEQKSIRDRNTQERPRNR